MVVAEVSHPVGSFPGMSLNRKFAQRLAQERVSCLAFLWQVVGEHSARVVGCSSPCLSGLHASFCLWGEPQYPLGWGWAWLNFGDDQTQRMTS